MGGEVVDKRLRLLQVVVQPVLVWDDGEELTPGPQLDAVTVTGAGLTEFAAELPRQVVELEKKLAAESEAFSAP